MSDKVKFHISDILSATTGMLVSVPEHTPINSDGSKWPVRVASFSGVVQLTGHVTGEKMTNPDTVQQVKALASRVANILKQQFPQLEKVQAPKITGATSAEKMASVKTWLKPLEAQFGSYLEVTAPEKKAG